MRLTVAQALVRFLSVQYSERDGVEQRLIAGCFGIFGHGNVAGVGQALLEQPDAMPFYHARNEQAMVHTAAALRAPEEPAARRSRARRSIGPGATNMVTGAALATINRLPVLLLPGDVFATRAPGTVLQELEDPTSYAVTVNDTLRPVSKFWDRDRAAGAARARAAGGDARADRPGRDRRGHARAAAGRAGRGVRLARRSCSSKRVWRVRRPLPEPDVLAEAAALIRGASKPADRRRRRHDLRRGDRRAARARRGDRDRRRRDAGRQGLAALRPSAGARRDRRHRHHRGQRRRARGRRDPRRRHALERLHDRVALAVLRRRRRSSTSTSRPSTRSSTPALPLVADARLGLEALNEALDVTLRDAGERLGRGRRARVHDAPRPARAGRGDRRRQPRERPARRRRLRGGLDARRPAQAVAHARPEGLPRRVRLLDDGLRDRRRPRRQDGRARPRGVRAWSATART